MTDLLAALKDTSKILLEIPLRPVQGQRFQPTGFPSLGAATYQTSEGTSLLVESPQSMANRLELACWDEARQRPKVEVDGISYVRVERQNHLLTSSMLEAHRLNSPYLLEGTDKTFFNRIKEAVGAMEKGPIDRKKLAETLLRFDAGSLLHGVFLAKKELAGGRLRVARVLSAFIEADGVRPAVSGGVKNDHVNPSGNTKQGFGNVPFAREEFTGDRITLYFNLDLAQIRGYGLGEGVERMLTLLALYKLRTLLSGNLRLRTACDLVPVTDHPVATSPAGFALPALEDLVPQLRTAIDTCGKDMQVTTVAFEDEFTTGSDKEEGAESEGDSE